MPSVEVRSFDVEAEHLHDQVGHDQEAKQREVDRVQVGIEVKYGRSYGKGRRVLVALPIIRYQLLGLSRTIVVDAMPDPRRD